MSNKKYWENYYQDHLEASNPSHFAKFVYEHYNPKGTIIELGCGNGRDVLFFASKNVHVRGVDQCSNVISKLNNLNLKNASFDVADFTNLLNGTKYDNVYSRFTLHSINKSEASKVIKWVFNNILQGGTFFIEVRSVKDEFYGLGDMIEKDAWFTDHYRRFIHLEELINELEEVGFKIHYQNESKGLAPYKDEDPVIIRIVCKK